MSNEITIKPAATFGNRGIEIRSYDELVRFAQTIADSGLSPKGMDKPQSIFVAIQMGMEVGLSPMASLQNVAVVNGRPTLWGDAILAVCRGTGELEEFSEWYEVGGAKTARNPDKYDDGTAAICRVKRTGGQVIESAFSVADAKRAGLWGKQGPWSQYPFRMLRNRARSFALRDGFGDALRGFRSTEEAMDEPRIVQGTVVQDAVPQMFLPSANGMQGDPASGFVCDPHETKPGVNFSDVLKRLSDDGLPADRALELLVKNGVVEADAWEDVTGEQCEQILEPKMYSRILKALTK